MPSATATFTLNVSAIQALCVGPRGSAMLNGSGVPSDSTGLPEDFYVDTSLYPLLYSCYGPKLSSDPIGTWPLTAVQFPTTTLLDSISSSLYSELTAISNTVNISSLSALNIVNNGLATVLTVTQQGNTYGKNIATFNHNTSTTFVITNSGNVGINVSEPNVDTALHVVGDTLLTQSLSVQGDILASTINVSTLTAANGGIFGSWSSIVSAGSNNLVQVAGLNLGDVSSYINVLSAYTAVFALLSSFDTRPVRIHGTLFEVGSGDGTAAINDRFFVVDPTWNIKRVTIAGSVSALSSFNSSVYDANKNQLLSGRRSAPARLTAMVSTSADIIASYNSLLDALTAHGLIR